MSRGFAGLGKWFLEWNGILRRMNYVSVSARIRLGRKGKTRLFGRGAKDSDAQSWL